MEARVAIRNLLFFSVSGLLLAQTTSGIDPRPSVADYPAKASNQALSIGAAHVAPSDQNRIFGRDWSGSYIIVEVSLYPETGFALTVAPRDFMLRSEGESVAPVDAEYIVPYKHTTMNNGPIGPDSKVHVATVDSIGVASGPNGRKAVYTDSQVYVGVGDTPYPVSAPPPRDHNADLRRPLEDKELPDIKAGSPVAGYLYFPKPKKAGKNAAFELDYYGESGQLKLDLGKRR
jgi:hypothetical protein